MVMLVVMVMLLMLLLLLLLPLLLLLMLLLLLLSDFGLDVQVATRGASTGVTTKVFTSVTPSASVKVFAPLWFIGFNVVVVPRAGNGSGFHLVSRNVNTEVVIITFVMWVFLVPRYVINSVILDLSLLL